MNKLLCLALLVVILKVTSCEDVGDHHSDTRLLSEIDDPRSEVTFQCSASYRIYQKVGDKLSFSKSLNAHISEDVNITEFVQLAGIGDPTVDELQDLFKEFTLIDLQRIIAPEMLNTKINDSHIMTSHPSLWPDEPIMDNGKLKRPTQVHRYYFRKYAGAVLPLYVIVTILGITAYIQKSKLFHHGERLIKLTNVSKLAFKVLAIRLIFDFMFLYYLITFVMFHFFSHWIYFAFFFIVQQAMDITVFHILQTVFVHGYLTLQYDKKTYVNKFSFVVTFLYFSSVMARRAYSAVEVIREQRFQETSSLLNVSFNGHTFNFSWLITIHFALGPFILILLVIRKFRYTYKKSNRDERLLKSFIVLSVVYLVSPYILVPVSLDFADNFLENLKILLTGRNFYNERVGYYFSAIPEIFHLVSGFALIYIWRDKSYKRIDEEQEEDGIELH